MAEPDETAEPPSLADVFADIARERARTGDEAAPPRAPAVDVPGAAPFFLGCLFRLVLLGFVLVALVVLALFMLFNS